MLEAFGVRDTLPATSVKLELETVRYSAVLDCSDPEVPVTVAVYWPAMAALLAVNTIVLDPEVGFGEKEAVTPLGNPVTARVTLPINPYCGFTETAVVPVLPWLTITLFVAKVKLGGTTVNDKVVVALRFP